VSDAFFLASGELFLGDLIGLNTSERRWLEPRFVGLSAIEKEFEREALTERDLERDRGGELRSKRHDKDMCIDLVAFLSSDLVRLRDESRVFFDKLDSDMCIV
jgi:hypothetical protein